MRENEVETHILLLSHISYAHMLEQTKPATRLRIHQSCYGYSVRMLQEPSIFAFLEVRCLNERLPGYRPSCTKNKRQNALPKEPTHFK